MAVKTDKKIEKSRNSSRQVKKHRVHVKLLTAYEQVMNINTSKNDKKSLMNPWVKNTRLYREWEDRKKDILLHKWYESEKAGHDIGWERAAVDWMVRFGGKTRKNS